MAVLTRYRVSDLATLEGGPGVAHFELSAGKLISVSNPGARHELIKTKAVEGTQLFETPLLPGFSVAAEQFFQR